MKARFTAEHCSDLLNALDQGFCIVEVLFNDREEPVDYRFLDVNDAFEHQTGLGDALGRRMRELAPAHEDHWFRIYGEVALTGAPKRFEHEAAALNRWYDVYAFRVGDPSQRRVAILFSDITIRKEADAALHRARLEAERANAAKDEFLAMLGHELRNPLAPMVIALQLMRSRGVHSSEQDVLERQVQHLSRMVDDLLDISRIVRGKVELKPEATDLDDVFVKAMELAGPILEQRRNLVDVQVAPPHLAIHVDRARMAQALSNLLVNAAKYSGLGSPIIVRGMRDGDVVRISVKDEGIGIAANMLEAMFEPFMQQPQTLDRSAGGLGLGLAIARNLVNAHGGTVRAQSDGHDRGSEFIIELPAFQPSADQRDEWQAEPSWTMRSQKRVLVVDDNPDTAEMLRTALEHFGYAVEVAFDGPSALARAARFDPSAVLLDIGLPAMDGYEVARRLRADRSGRSVRLLALTGYGQEADRYRSHDAGFDHHLVKPIDLDRLQALLEADNPTED